MRIDADQLARERLVGHITGCWRTKAIHAGVALRLPDLLAGGPRPAGVLARETGCVPDALHRLLRALCTLDICQLHDDGTFGLTRTGELLRSDVPHGAPGLRALALWWGGPMWVSWDGLDASVRTGRSAREQQTGRLHYGFLDGEPAMASLFHEAMQAQTGIVAAEVAGLPTWRDARGVVDVGGGHGELALAIAAAHPSVRATVFDREDARAGAEALVAQRGLLERVRFVAGDFFAALPTGADRYVLKSILHNWADEDCVRLLATCAAAAPRGARLVIVERLVPAQPQPCSRDEAVARADLNMLIGLGGRERTLAQFAALLEPAGFRLRESHALSHEFDVLEAERR